ncbi:hypothetical protein GWK18_06215 [Kocuria sp. JC486]|uniref:hypothetical protein n=1 Tax=Kocuria sp. JC486 TaxID=1970736 RepID=UPI001422D5B9|nr:hypothetical protein [Kocuria sp. JC486]NHU85191.1 hypothetical protein [Kocuria sp. JC486]
MEKHNLFDDGSEESDLLGGEAVPERGESPEDDTAENTTESRDPDPRGDDPLQGFSRLDADRASDSSVTWSSVGVAVVGLLLTVLLFAFSYNAFQRADQLRGWANQTWVVSGQYSNMTNALEGTEYNPVYQITLPQDDEIGDQRFDSGMADPYFPRPGESVEVRGEGTGEVTDDFEQSADIVLGVEDDTLQVLATEKDGELDGGVTDRTVSQQQLKGWLWAVAGVVTLGLGVAGAMWMRRRNR